MLQTRQQNIQYGDDTYPRDLSLILPNQRMHTKFGILPVCVIARARGKCLSICLPTSSFMLLQLYVFSWSSQVYKNVSSLKYDLFIVFWICPYFPKYYTPKKSFPTRLGNKTERNLLNILSITHALLSESKIFFEENFVYTTIARRTAAGSLKTQWWRRLSTNQGKE